MPVPDGFTPSLLRPFDCLLYRPRGFFGWLIAIKQARLVSHCELYEGDGYSLASRDGLGVNRYRLRIDGLAYVLRPTQPVNAATLEAWFERIARGQKYDWKAIARWLWPGTVDTDLDRMICSAFMVRAYREGGFHPFSLTADADLIGPGHFLDSPLFARVWSDGK